MPVPGVAWRRRALALAALALLTVLMRLPALTHPQPIDDEGVYSVVANEMVDGGLPYRDAIERKPPLLFWTYAAVFKVSGKSNWTALHAVATLWLLGTMAGVWVIGRQLFDDEAGQVAALLYCVFQPWATWRNLAFNGEMMMNLPVVWAWALVLGTGRPLRRLRLVAAGALSCAAFLLKQPAAIAAVPLVAYFWLPAYRGARTLSWRDSLAESIHFGAGGLVMLLGTGFVPWRDGIFADAVYWTINDHDIPHMFWMRALLFTSAFVGACLPLVAGAWLALTRRSLWRERPAEMTAIAWLALLSGVGAAASGRFYPHYYIQLLPPLAILAGGAYWAVRRGVMELPRWWPSTRAVCAWTAACAVAFSAAHWYGLAQRREPSATGRWVREHAQADDRIFVWGQAAQVYLDADRRPASRFIATFPLTGYIFGGPLPGIDTRSRILPGAWDTLERDFALHPPAFIVDADAGPGAQYPLANFPVLATLVKRDFAPVFTSADGVVYGRRAR